MAVGHTRKVKQGLGVEDLEYTTMKATKLWKWWGKLPQGAHLDVHWVVPWGKGWGWGC